MTRVLVTGGRDYSDRNTLDGVLDALCVIDGISCVVHGAAKGADALAAEWAARRGVATIVCPADWDDLDAKPCRIKRNRAGKLYNALAGINRNKRMLQDQRPALVIAFPGGSGTADMVRRARRAKLPVHVVA